MKYRRVRMSSDLLISLFVTGAESHIKCASGLPEGTKFKYITQAPVAGIDLVVEHESFNLLKDGDEIPLHPEILMEKVYD